VALKGRRSGWQSVSFINTVPRFKFGDSAMKVARRDFASPQESHGDWCARIGENIDSVSGLMPLPGSPISSERPVQKFSSLIVADQM